MLTDENPENLAAQAERCRRLAGATYNREISEILDQMAEEYERSAEERSDERNN